MDLAAGLVAVKTGGAVLLTQVALRLGADACFYLSEKTKRPALKDALWVAGKIVGYLGAGMSKRLIVAETAKQPAEDKIV